MAGYTCYTCTGRYRDLRRCLKSLDSFTDGQARILDWDTEELEFVRLQLAPKEGAYKGGRFDFEVWLPDDYPMAPPTVICLTNVYHPNIKPRGEGGDVCLSLFSEWEDHTMSFGLDDVVQGLLFLFYNPNHDDPLTTYYRREDMEANFEENLQKALLGEDVGDFTPSEWGPVVLEVPLSTELKDGEEQLRLVEDCVEEREKAGLIGDTVGEDEERERTETEQNVIQGEEQSHDETKEMESPDNGVDNACAPAVSGAAAVLPETQSDADVDGLSHARNDINSNDNLMEESEEISRSFAARVALPLDVTTSEPSGEVFNIIRNDDGHDKLEDSKGGSGRTNAADAVTAYQTPEASSSEVVGQIAVPARDGQNMDDRLQVMECNTQDGGKTDVSATTIPLHSNVHATEPDSICNKDTLFDASAATTPLQSDVHATEPDSICNKDTLFDTNNNDNPEQFHKPFVEQQIDELAIRDLQIY